MQEFTRAAAATALAVALTVTGCTPKGTDSPGGERPPANLPSAETNLQSVATALSNLDVTGLAVTGDAAVSQADLDEVVDGLGDVKPTVTPKGLAYDAAAKTATGTLDWSWPFYPKPWTYTGTVRLRLEDKQWKLIWASDVVHPSVTPRSRLEATRLLPDRARILDNGGTPIVELRDVVRIGLDKSRVSDPAQQEASARAIAALVKIDADAYVAQVRASGAKAFVLALVDRGSLAPAGLGDIPGGYARHDRLMLTPYKDFGGPLVGTLGEPTQEVIAASGGAVAAGDTVGRSGLQGWHDAELRGTPGLEVDLVQRANAPAPAASAAPEVLPALLTKVDKIPGKDLGTSLDVALQTKLEGLLANEPVATAVALVQPSTGKVLALAQSPSANGEALSNWAHVPPGSTFKVASSLALVRAGLTADSPVQCPESITVDGRTLKNYPGYPSAHNGTIPLKDALAFSCNTAFVSQTPTMGEGGLAKAAGSLGMGTDYDAGFRSYYGEVPPPTNVVGAAEQSFGQGTVLVSPMAVAGMAASVKAGRTVVPWLVEPGPITPTTTPLTGPEAAQLQTMMRQVVDVGSLTELKGVIEGGKTGTAEFGTADDLKTHVWLTGYTSGDLAFAAYREVGQYGTDLVPLVKAMLG